MYNVTMHAFLVPQFDGKSKHNGTTWFDIIPQNFSLGSFVAGNDSEAIRDGATAFFGCDKGKVYYIPI